MELEESIIQAIQQGEYDQFEKLYNSYFDKIYAFILIKTNGNNILTEDICSETFLKAFEKIKDFHYENGNFKSWIFTIAYHTFIDFIKTQNPQSLQEWEYQEDGNNIIDLFEKKERTREIISYLETLGEGKTDLFLLRIRNQLKYDEI